MDYKVPPGWLLDDYLEERGYSEDAFAKMCGLPAKLISQISEGKAPIDAGIAEAFEKILGVRAHVWLNLETAYRA